MRRSPALLFLFFFFSPFFFSGRVVALTEDISPKTNTEQLIFERANLETEIQDLKASYRSQLEEYLYKEKLYRVAYEQNKKLQTLASIEDLLQKSKDLGMARDQVLQSYLNLLRLNLIATEGVELSLKNNSLQELESRIAYLAEHQKLLGELTDRGSVQTALLDFKNEQEDLQKFSEGILSLLTIARLQIIYDKELTLKVDVNKQFLNEKNAENLVLQRASQEIDQSLASADLKLTEFWADLLEDSKKNPLALSRLYRDLPSKLNPIYVNLSQSLSYLGEILKN